MKYNIMILSVKSYKKPLNYLENFLVFVSAVSARVSISTFASLIVVSVGIASSAEGSTICAVTAGIKKCKSIIKTKKKKHDKIVLLAKTKLNTIEVLISKALIDSYINHDKIVSVNNVLREYNEMKDEIKYLKMLFNILNKNNGNLLCQL